MINSQVILSEFPVGNNHHHRVSGVGDIIVVPACTYILVYGREEETLGKEICSYSEGKKSKATWWKGDTLKRGLLSCRGI